MQGSALPIVEEANEEQIAELVHRFYGRVRKDEVLGPVFARAIGDDWEAHLARMCEFWSTVVLASRRYKANPMAVQLEVPKIGESTFSAGSPCGDKLHPSFSVKPWAPSS